ncbi:MAG: 4-hydroxybenzoate octaprenyltransferase [Planktomarina sp.]
MTDNTKVPEGTVADAVNNNWVDMKAPPWTRPYLRLSRADRPIGTWLLFIPCLWAVLLAGMADALRVWDLWLIVSAAAGAFLMRGAGCVWNDYTDRHVDAQVERTKSRPLPSGQVTGRAAIRWMIIQAQIAFVILLSYGIPAIAVGVASVALVAIYPFAKRFTWWPQAFLGLAFNWGAILMWVAHSGGIAITPLLLYMSGIVWTLFYDTIYAHQDAEDDALIGVKSTARLFGENTSKWLWGFVYLSALLMASAVEMTGASGWQLIIALIGVAGFAAHLIWQLRTMDINDNSTLLHLFRANRDAGLIPVPFFAIAAML